MWNEKPLSNSWQILFNSVTWLINLGISTAFGHLRPLNSMFVSSLKKLSMDNVDMDLWFTGVGDKAKICILVDIPYIMLSYVWIGMPWTYLPGGGKDSQSTLECMNL